MEAIGKVFLGGSNVDVVRLLRLSPMDHCTIQEQQRLATRFTSTQTAVLLFRLSIHNLNPCCHTFDRNPHKAMLSLLSTSIPLIQQHSDDLYRHAVVGVRYHRLIFTLRF